MKKLLFLIVLGSFVGKTNAQQEYLYSQYFNNLIYYNPAATGANDYHTATAFFRKQWAGVKGSPWNGLVSYDAPFQKVNMGLGGFVSREVVGVTYNTSFMVNYAYHVKTSKKTKLAFGIGAGLDVYTSRLNELTYWDEDDAVYAQAINGKAIPHFGFGMFFHMEQLRVGISIPRLFNINTDELMKITLKNSPNLARHFYLTAEYDFKIGDKWKLTPGTMMRYVVNAPFQADISLRASFRDEVFFGTSYRTLGFVSVYAQYKIKNLCLVGYAFDFTTSDMKTFSQGTHEVMLSFEFLKKDSKTKSSMD
ncbi:MAG: type IX secretion system membrane protein PorP/SprF [Crocinitomicaceae bacterium]